MDRLPVAVLFFDEHDRLLMANQAALEILARPRNEMIGLPARSLCAPLADLMDKTRLSEETSQNFHCPTREQDFHIYIAPLVDTETEADCRMVIFWIIGPAQSLVSIHADGPGQDLPALDLLETVLESIKHGILVCNQDGLPLYYNPSLLAVWEEPASFLSESGSGWPLLLSRRMKNPERLIRLMQAAQDQPGAEMYDFLELLSGRVLECHSRVQSPLKNHPPVRVWSFEDITEQQRTERELHHLSTHDGLTGLFNRAFFELQIRQLYNYPAYPVSMIMVDVDGLKKINDRYGHPAGDILLIQAADVLRRACRTDDIVARLGGDEFGILLLRAGREAAEKVLDRIGHLQTLQNIDHPDVPLSLSLGMATAEGKAELTDLFSRADAEMYHTRFHKRHIQPLPRRYWGKRHKPE